MSSKSAEMLYLLATVQVMLRHEVSYYFMKYPISNKSEEVKWKSLSRVWLCDPMDYAEYWSG